MKISTVCSSLLALVMLSSFPSTTQAWNVKFFGKFRTSPMTDFEGAVYAMTNKVNGNTIVAYGRNSDGTLEFINEFRTGGRGGIFDGGEGLDPLLSANSLILTENRRFLVAVNAGSQSISVFGIQSDFSLRLTARTFVAGVGPNSLAYRDGILYVTSIDADGNFASAFNGQLDQVGNLSGFFLSSTGRLTRISRSVRWLSNRPSDVHFSPDGKFLVVASVNAGSAALSNEDSEEIVVYGVNRDGTLSKDPISMASSTERGNGDNRNLPSAIGFNIVEDRGNQFIVATEARDFLVADGTRPPALEELQAGSVSTWQLQADGNLTPVNLDVMAGDERTACWLDFSITGEAFWVVNALESTISTFSFSQGNIALLAAEAIAGNGPSDSDPIGTTDGWIDLQTSDDGKYLYQLYGLSGIVGVFGVERDGFGTGLTLIQEIGGLPDTNTQGIVAI